MLCECMFQPTAAVSVCKQTMPVDGASTIKCAVVLQLPALVKLTGLMQVSLWHGVRVFCVNVRTCMAVMTLRTAKWD